MRRSLGHRVASLVLPLKCLGCGQESDWLCRECAGSLRPPREDSCLLCRRYSPEGRGICPSCSRKTALRGIVSPLAIKEPHLRELIHHIKYAGRIDAIRFCAVWLGRWSLERLPKSFTLVPVPLSRARQIQRGFNQAELYAKAISGAQTPLKRYLVRTRETAPQVSLSRQDRSANVKNCFSSREKIPSEEVIVLVDDVVTTGSTLREAARALRAAGAKQIWALTIAHG